MTDNSTVPANTGFDAPLDAINSASFPAILRWTSFLSLVGSFACMLVYLIYVRRSKYNNLTARLVFHTSFYDFILSVSLMAIIDITAGGPTCNFLMFLQTWGVVGGNIVPCCIAYCVQQAIVSKSIPTRLERYFHSVSFAASLIIALLPLTASAYGWDDQFGYCWYVASATTGLGWTLGTYYLWIMLSLTYNCAIFTWAAIVTYRLYHSSKDVRTNLSDQQRKSERSHYLLVLRFMLYPIIIVIVQFGNVGSQIQAWKTGEFHFVLTLMNQAFGTLQGFFYALVWFGFDGAFRTARSRVLGRCVKPFEIADTEETTASGASGTEKTASGKDAAEDVPMSDITDDGAANLEVKV